jgi:hypothetical protein
VTKKRQIQTKRDKTRLNQTKTDNAPSSPSIFVANNQHNKNTKKMNQTKTAVILSIVAIVGIGVIIYALRDNFKSKPSEKTVTVETAE